MRKKQAMLWLLLCGVCVIGGAAYLNKAEPLKAADKSETAQTKQTVPTAKTKAVAKTPAVTQTGEEMVPIGPPDENYSTLPNFNFQKLSGDVDPSNTNRASIPEGYGFVGSRKEEQAGAINFALFANYLPIKQADSRYNTMYGTYNPFASTDPYKQYYAVYYANFTGDPRPGRNGATEFMWQRLPSPSNPEIAAGLAFAYNTFNGNGHQGGLATTKPVVKYNPNEAFGYAYGEYEIGSTDFFDKAWASTNNSPGATKESMIRIWLRAQIKNTIDASDYTVGNIKDLASHPVDSFFMGFNKNAFWDQPHKNIVDKYFTIYVDDLYKTPIFFRNLMVLMTSVHANPDAIKIPLGKDVVPYLTADALKQTMGDVYYYPDAANNEYDYNDPQGGLLVDASTITDLKILSNNVPTSDLISKKKLVIQFKYQTPDTQETKVGIVPIDFEVTAGNSIFLGGDEKAGIIYKNNPNLSSLALTLNLNNVGTEAAPQYQIAATKGNNPNGDAAFNTKADATQPYYQVDYFAPPADGETLNLNQDLTTKGTENGSLVAVKDSTPNALISSWGTGGKLDVELGGVLRVYMSDPTKEWLYQNDELNEFKPNNLPQKNYVFYQVTENGLEPMYNNKVETDNTVANVPKIGYDAPASAVNVAFDSEPDKHLKKINDVDYTGIHFSWNFSRGTTTTDQGKTIDIPASVTGKSMNPDIAIEFPIQPDPRVQVLKEEYETWLPDFPDRWRNSMTESIPKQNAFVMMEMADTEIVDYDLPLVGEKPIDGALGGTYQIHLDEGKTSWIKFKNVGFYDGKKIGVQVSVTPNKSGASATRKTSAYIGYKGSRFLNVSILKQMESAEVKYDFFDSETNKPVTISCYWTVSNLNTSKTFSIGLDDFDEIFSVDRHYEENDVAKPIAIKYLEETEMLTLIGTAANSDSSISPIQKSVTLTLKERDHFQYTMTATAEITTPNLLLYYESQTDAFVEIPDPVGEAQVFDTITANNYPDQAGKIKDPLNIKFYQYIPYESERNRGRSIKWTLPAAAVNKSVGENGEWIVTDETGTDVSDRFIIDEGKMVPKDVQDESFYNRYYFFQKNLLIDDQEPIEESALSVKDEQGHRYFDYRGKITLEAQGFDPVSSDFHSKINFAAEADFEPVYRDSEDGNKVKPVPGSSTQTEKNLLITHKYTEVTPTPIDGYEYADESIPENYTELPVCYTQAKDNKVQLVYEKEEELGGELFFNIPEEMNFGDILVPKTGFGILGKSKYLQSVDPAWGIAVTDTRPADQRKPYTLTAQVINQSFEPAKQTRDYQGKSGENEYTNDQIPLVSNILNFAMESGKPLSLGEPVVIYDTGNTPKDDPNYKIQWDHSNTGFLVDLKAFGNYPEGTYQATIDFTVEYGME